MSAAILIISLMIVFNVAEILGDNKETIFKKNKKELEKNLWENRIEKTKGITGFAVSDENQTQNSTNPKSEELYSEKSYIIYYVILIFLGVGIFLVSVGFILPKIKKYT